MSPAFLLAVRFMRQTVRQRSFRVLMASLVVATATVITIGLFQLALGKALLSGSAELMAADRQLNSTKPVEIDLASMAEQHQLEWAEGITFRTMLSHRDEMQLVAVKAVSEAYPLKGVVERKMNPGEEVQASRQGPIPGEVWVSERLLGLLGVNVGESVGLGTRQLKVGAILVKEPDMQVGFEALAPRVLISVEDARNSGLLMPGSRVDFVYYFAGDEERLRQFEEILTPQLIPGQRFQGVREGRPQVANSLNKAEQYLSLGGVLALALTFIAILIAGREFSLSQFDQVGLLKALGCTHARIRTVYFWILGVASVAGGGLGILLGTLFFSVGAGMLSEVTDLPGIDELGWITVSRLFGLSLLSALVCTYAFLVPMLSRFKRLSPMIVFRQSDEVIRLPLLVVVLNACILGGLLVAYVGVLKLVVGLLVGLALLLTLSAVLVGLVLKGLTVLSKGSWFTRYPGFILKLGFHHLARHQQQVSAQVFSLSAAVMVLVILTLTRTTLVSEWRSSLPEHAPNHFLINIAPDDVAPLQDLLNETRVEISAFYPMTRGRLVTINQKPVKEVVSKEQEVGALNRELNLTWSDQIPESNALLSGSWWETADESDPSNIPMVSVESQLASRLGVVVGDELGFLIGSRPLNAKVMSIRSVQWDSLKPNFYMVFNPGALLDFPATSITSFYLEPEKKWVLNRIQQDYPTVSILEVDQFIARIQKIIDQVSGAIELLLILVGAGSVLVVISIINTSIKIRLKEGAMVRALGGSSSLLTGGQLTEYITVGLMASIWGIICAEITVSILMSTVFGMTPVVHWVLWPMITAGTIALVSSVALFQLRGVTRVPPKLVLQWDR